jgi:radical SAM-linked protein
MRIRLTFSKSGPIQYVGHLDLHRSWERTFRRSGLPLEYSQGFHPQPHLNLACALPLGFSSQSELLDVWLEKDLSLEEIRDSLIPALPPGLELLDLAQVDNHSPALQTQVVSAVYIITFFDDIHDLPDRLQRVLSAEQIIRTRRDKTYDLRPLVEIAFILPPANGEKQKMQVQMAARQAATGRPEELLSELNVEFKDTQIHRIKLILNNN